MKPTKHILLIALMTLAAAGTARAAFLSIQKESVDALANVGTSVVGCSDEFVLERPEMNVEFVTQASAVDPSLEVTGEASDNASLKAVRFYYRKTLGTTDSVIQSTFSCGVNSAPFAFQVPDEAVTSEGVLYRLEVEDAVGHVTQVPSIGYIVVEVSGFAMRSIGVAGGTIAVPDSDPSDGTTALDIPAGALDQNVTITIEELRPTNFPAQSVMRGRTLSPNPASVFRFEPSGLTFKKPVTLRLLYPDKDHDGTVDETDQKENIVQLFLWNEGTWTTMGGKVNDQKNEVSTKIHHFSVYAAIPAVPLAPQDYRPTQKIITPGRADGQNDAAVFGFLGPDARIEIFDSNGVRVRTLQGVLTWDGRDDDGKVVESGVYVYQYMKDGERVSGVIAVAK